MIRRREFIMLLGGAAAWPFALHAQQVDKMYRVGILSSGLNNPISGQGFPILLAELRKHPTCWR